ncbi:MAG: HAD hydrolase family protein [Aquihabitans sp.]
MAAEPLDLTDLLIPFGVARCAVVAAAEEGRWLDASLLAAGCSQVVEDHVHRSEGFVDRVAVHLAGEDSDPGRVARAVGAVGAAIRTGHRARPSVDGLLDQRDQLGELTIALSGAAQRIPDEHRQAALVRQVEQVLGAGGRWPDDLAGRVLRLPSSFRSFDQQPADVEALVAMAAERWPDRDRPMLVVGIRTSGSSMGPMAVAAFRELGYRNVALITMRADERLDRTQEAAAQRARTGTVLLIDDPPVSGATVRDCIRPLQRAGVGAASIAVLLALPEGWKLAPLLDPCDRILLPGPRWRMTELMEPAAIVAAAARLLQERELELVGSPTAIADPVGDAPGGSPRTAREHRRAAFSVVLRSADGAVATRTLLAQGVGIGLYGHHDQVVAERLGPWAPDVLGVVDGVMYQLLDLVDDGPALGPDDVAAYVHHRQQRLPARHDHAADMRGRKAAWEIAAMLVGGALGRIDAAVRTPLVNPIVREILRVEQPSIIDGRMTADRFLAVSGGGWVKADLADGAFSNRDLWSYDAVADLAAIADDLGRPGEVLAAWNDIGGAPVHPSRWALLRLAGAWDRHRHGGLPQPSYGRTISRILGDHVGAHYLADLPAATGPWCVSDVDGVLETSVFGGGTAPGRRGGEAMRALAAHGYRLVPATGRSVSEVRQRLEAWHLPFGIAEYGSALLVEGEVVDLRDADQAAATDRARKLLADRPDVVLDDAYQRCVRAWRTIDGRGRLPLTSEQVAEVVAELDGAVAIVPGEDQTDIVAAGVSKERAVRAMLDRLDPRASDAARPLALAVGDGPADIGLLGLGATSVAPAHAADDVRAAATHAVRGSYQQGLADAVELLIGHRPGACPTCAPHLDPASDALLEVLSVHEAGLRGMPGRLAGLTVDSRRAARRTRR